MTSCVRNIHTENYQNLAIGFQVTVEKVGDVFETQCSFINAVLRVGAIGVICSIMWFFLVYDSPAQHPRISDEEREYIEKALNARDREKVSFCKSSFIFTSFCCQI